MSPTQDEIENLHILGGGSLPQVTDGPKRSMLEAFPNRFPERRYFIVLSFPEFTSLCPVTGQPDFGTISVEYIPDKLCLESKSFKLYMVAYRNHQSFMETITNNILEDIMAVIEPNWCRVKGLFAPRGGTHIHVFAEQYKKMDNGKLMEISLSVAEWLQEANPHIWR